MLQPQHTFVTLHRSAPGSSGAVLVSQGSPPGEPVRAALVVGVASFFFMAVPPVLMACFVPQKPAAVTRFRGQTLDHIPGGRRPPDPDYAGRWGWGMTFGEDKAGIGCQTIVSSSGHSQHACFFFCFLFLF